MKTKLRFLFALVGLAGIVALIILLVLDVYDFNELWVDYAFGVSILFVVIPLNSRAAKKDEFYDALRNVKDSRFALSKIDPTKRVGLLNLQAARNQLADLEICFREIVNNHDLYALVPLLEQVGKAENHYKDDDNFQASLTETIVKEDLELLDKIEAELLKLRENR